jgi:hypothetical protein
LVSSDFSTFFLVIACEEDLGSSVFNAIGCPPQRLRASSENLLTSEYHANAREWLVAFGIPNFFSES